MLLVLVVYGNHVVVTFHHKKHTLTINNRKNWDNIFASSKIILE